MNERHITSNAKNPARPMVALTFDDGPSPKYTPEILKVLRENGAKATFFVLGARAERNPAILKQIAAGGNEIGNHSYSHLDLTKLEKPALDYQVLTTEEIVRREIGKAPSLLRPPYGNVNTAVREIGMPIILWSVDSLDWKNRNPDIIYHRVVDGIKDGDVVINHDIYQTTAEAVARIIPELKRKGYQLVTVSELARAKGIPLRARHVYGRLSPRKK